MEDERLGDDLLEVFVRLVDFRELRIFPEEARQPVDYDADAVVGGMVVFAVAAKVDAEKWHKWAWPLMGMAIFTMLLTVLPFTKSIAPPIHGSRRFLVGGSLQPSEFAKIAVIIWTSMLLVKKQENGSLRRLTKGLLPFCVVVGNRSRDVKKPPTYDDELRGVSAFTADV